MKVPEFAQHRFARRRLTAGLICATALLGGCAAVQTTQPGLVGVDRTQYMSSLVSEAQLEQQATQQYNQLISQARAKGSLDVDAAQTKRVRGIAARLIKQVGAFRPDAVNWNWQVHVLKTDQVNAWCMPGGKIAVYSGLINKLKPTDAELAAVLGHEMAHALREHAREQVSQQMAANMGLSILAAVTGSRQAADLGSQLNQVMFALPNSRTDETEADQIGIGLAARAGYDPRAAVTLWKKMAALSAGNQPPQFLSTHPSAENRIADLQAMSQRVMPLYEQAKKSQ
jgi:predicted Zn-dependent protease